MRSACPYNVTCSPRFITFCSCWVKSGISHKKVKNTTVVREYLQSTFFFLNIWESKGGRNWRFGLFSDPNYTEDSNRNSNSEFMENSTFICLIQREEMIFVKSKKWRQNSGWRSSRTYQLYLLFCTWTFSFISVKFDTNQVALVFRYEIWNQLVFIAKVKFKFFVSGPEYYFVIA